MKKLIEPKNVNGNMTMTYAECWAEQWEFWRNYLLVAIKTPWKCSQIPIKRPYCEGCPIEDCRISR